MSPWVNDVLGRLSLSERVAQLLLVLPGVEPDALSAQPSRRALPDEATLSAVRAGTGSVHGVRLATPSDAARYHARLQEVAAESTGVAVLTATNLETGLSYTLDDGGTDVPYARGIGLADDVDLAYAAAAVVAAEARQAGFTWSFSPCVDVTTAPDDPVIGVRAFGDDPAQVARLGVAQIRGLQDNGLLATAKHFPGHGDATVDSHLDLPRIDRDQRAHEEVHLVPFKAAAAAGVAAMMTAHLSLPRLGVTGTATLDPRVCTDLARTEVGFDGVLVSDSLRMGAVTSRLDLAESAILALLAGCDVANLKCDAALLPAVLATVVAAVRDGRLSESRVDEATRRVLTMKALAGLHRAPPPDPEAAMALDRPRRWEHAALARTVRILRGPGLSQALSGGPLDVVTEHGDARLVTAVQECVAVPVRFWAPDDLPALPPEGSRAVLLVTGGRSPTPSERSVAERVSGWRVSVAVLGLGLSVDADEFAPQVSVVHAPGRDVFGVVSRAAVREGMRALARS